MKKSALQSLILLGLAGSSWVSAQSYGDGWSTIDAGSGQSSGESFRLSGTVGQPDAGPPAVGGSYSLTGGFWSGVRGAGALPQLRIFIISPAMPPNLNARVTLAWPYPSTGFHLEAAPAPIGAQWFTVPEAPGVVGNEYQLSLEATGNGRMFRLRSP